MKVFDKITVFLSKAVDMLSFVGYAIVLVVLLIQVVARYVFNYGIQWTDEFSRYVMTWLVLLSSATLVRDKGHIRMTIIETILPKPFHRWLDLIIHILIAVFAILVFRYSLTTLKFAARAVSTSMRIPMTCIYASFTFSTLIMALNAVFNVLSNILQRKKAEIDKEGVVE